MGVPSLNDLAVDGTLNKTNQPTIHPPTLCNHKERGLKIMCYLLNIIVNIYRVSKFLILFFLIHSKVQARYAFATYLTRVQQRLITETKCLDADLASANEQMDLVLRFLKRAAGNLQQPFRVVVPSRKLAVADRRRILAKQLCDFVHVYNKVRKELFCVALIIIKILHYIV